ncbi:MAG: rhomboid family intramembrane serine protease [Candidatus Edwardsbacteria bacterium]|nr:rhomboid family intramembrane serine protease [Candidatus Edwardsbacteria bacterium]MBU1576889.1 rhomboid family intramembrane serine protease [Candidatus Edwardsbacteria bacterium]MBU2463691.1 rhomboid family intramembrane serine protease [Candidatus Edwardsbacteria bacterium]MBU2594250.1 rhomboid family intramembrane serine protease [Candidatus Edwardsbacteria bacterium]
MIPLKDDIPSSRFPVVNTILIALNGLVFFYEVGLGHEVSQFIQRFGMIPANLMNQGFGGWGNIFSSMFIHGGWEHIIGNMLYLFIFGDNVEDALGHFRYLLFYLLCGIAAAWGHILFNPHSIIPTVGASGAVAGVLGAYLLLYPRARVLTVIPIGIFIRIIKVPAVLVLGFWIVLQLLFGLISLPLPGEQSGGIAWFAHIGGFFTGMLLASPFIRRRNKGSFV